MTTREIQVHFLPDLTTPQQLAGSTVVVIDVLRATTTITYAFAAGANDVIATLEVDEARRTAAELPQRQVILGGERRGVAIEGFDLGNSPAEYTPETVAGKTIVFTTTNGTYAMAQCEQARRILLGAFVNLTACCRQLRSCDLVHLVCAGTRGHVSREDVLAAGAMVETLVNKAAGSPVELDDGAQLARAAWQGLVEAAGRDNHPLATQLAKEFRETRGGRNLIAIGHADDLELAADIDRLAIVAQLDPQSWRIRSP